MESNFSFSNSNKQSNESVDAPILRTRAVWTKIKNRSLIYILYLIASEAHKGLALPNFFAKRLTCEKTEILKLRKRNKGIVYK